MITRKTERRNLCHVFFNSKNWMIVCFVLCCIVRNSHIVVGLHEVSVDNDNSFEGIADTTDDSLYDPVQADPDSCIGGSSNMTSNLDDPSCYTLPESTIEEENVKQSKSYFGFEYSIFSEKEELSGITCSYGGDDPDAHLSEYEDQVLKTDKHWGSDQSVLKMRRRLLNAGSGESIKLHVLRKLEDKKKSKKVDNKNGMNDANNHQDEKYDYNIGKENRRPPIFLLPGLASTRLVAWRPKSCLLSDIKLKDYVWLNLNLIMQMSTIDLQCLSECLKLGWNQSDTDDINIGCKLRPDEGLDAISTISPGFVGQQLTGGTNTVYSWLIQWLAENLGYDVTSIVGLPYDWRLSPDKMESRDGFLTLTRHRIEAAVQSNGGEPGIMVAHSMGNLIFRYFLNWLRSQLRKEAYNRYVKLASKRNAKRTRSGNVHQSSSFKHVSGWTTGSGKDDNSSTINYTEIPPPYISSDSVDEEQRLLQFRELAIIEGDDSWYEWIESHIWTYMGLSAPLLGAVNPVRSVISGESMGLPVSNDAARWIEISFGSTHTVNPVSTQAGFCDEWKINQDWDEEPDQKSRMRHADSELACMDDIMSEIEVYSDLQGQSNESTTNPWEHFPALERILRKRTDWDTDFPLIRVMNEVCAEKEKSPCVDSNVIVDFGPVDVQTGDILTRFSQIWKEKDDPLGIKRDQLRESFWETEVHNMLNETWDRPLIKHVVMAYGVDIPTEVGYEYRKSSRAKKKDKDDGKSSKKKKDDSVDGKKTDKDDERSSKKKKDESYDGIPTLSSVVWELEGGELVEERTENQALLGDLLTIRKTKKTPFKDGTFHHSGDGSVPYISLSWAHTWLLHAARALRFSKQINPDLSFCSEGNCNNTVINPLDDIKISHRPKGKMEWINGPPPRRFVKLGEKKIESSSDTGTKHPHGTKYKPEMIRYHNHGISRTTGIEYTTTVIEAIGVEHKETPRNFDILAAVFTDVLKFMHDDFDIV